MKKKILIFIDWYLPGYKAGGPIRSVSNLVQLLNKEFQFYIVTSDTDFGNSQPYKNVLADKWNEVDGISVLYLSKKEINFLRIKKIITTLDFDSVYFNSLFSLWFTIVPLIVVQKFMPNKKVVIAPRGMFGAGAISIKKHKKIGFLKIAKLLRLFKDVLWHVTSDVEKNDVKKYFGDKVKAHVASNIPSVTFENVSREKNTNQLKLIFYSRISEVKNLKGALEILSKLVIDGDVEFDIYGPIENEIYWQECSLLIGNMNNKSIKVQYKNEVKPENILEVFNEYHFLFLPTFHENYGHVIAEAMSTGLPVIISDRTPWRGLEVHKAGWDISIKNIAGFSNAIQSGMNLTQEEYNEMSERTTIFAKKQINYDSLSTTTRVLFD